MQDYLVIATLYRMGGGDKLLATALGDIEEQPEPLSVRTLASAHSIYHGSLTTEPYTENVTWVVAEGPCHTTRP